MRLAEYKQVTDAYLPSDPLAQVPLVERPLPPLLL